MTIEKLPTRIFYKKKTWFLSVQFGEHAHEWECCYKRYFEFSEPEKSLSTYGSDLKRCLGDLSEKIKDNKIVSYLE